MSQVFVRVFFVVAAVTLLAGCATSSIDSRRQERLPAYQNLASDQKAMVDTGQIRVGMNGDAVYIAWGPPSEVLEGEDPNGHFVTWRYYGTELTETRIWAYREVGYGYRDIYLERYPVTDFTPRDYVRAEIVFKGGNVASWRTLPRPTQ